VVRGDIRSGTGRSVVLYVKVNSSRPMPIGESR
jgi:hypothetical protein